MTTTNVKKLNESYNEASVGLLKLRRLLEKLGQLPLANEIENIAVALDQRGTALKELVHRSEDVPPDFIEFNVRVEVGFGDLDKGEKDRVLAWLNKHHTGQESWPLDKRFDQDSPVVKASAAVQRGRRLKFAVKAGHSGEWFIRNVQLI